MSIRAAGARARTPCTSWALRVDHPLALSQWQEPVGKGTGLGQIDVFAEEFKMTVTMGVVEFLRLARHPPVGIGREAAARHDAVHMWMVSQGRPPSVQHQGHA